MLAVDEGGLARRARRRSLRPGRRAAGRPSRPRPGGRRSRRRGVAACAVVERVRDVGRAGGERVVPERSALALRPALRERLAEAAGEDQLRVQVGVRVLRELSRRARQQRRDRPGRGRCRCRGTGRRPATAPSRAPVESEQMAASGAGRRGAAGGEGARRSRRRATTGSGRRTSSRRRRRACAAAATVTGARLAPAPRSPCSRSASAAPGLSVRRSTTCAASSVSQARPWRRASKP